MTTNYRVPADLADEFAGLQKFLLKAKVEVFTAREKLRQREAELLQAQEELRLAGAELERLHEELAQQERLLANRRTRHV